MRTNISRFLVGASLIMLLSFFYKSNAQIPLNVVQSQFQKKQDRYDAGYDLALQAYNRINKLKSENTDNELLRGLNSLMDEIRSIEDFGAEYNRIKRITADVDNEIYKYNDRIRARQNQSSVFNQTNNTGTTNTSELALKYWQDASKSIQKKDYEDAIQCYTKLLQLKPNDADSYQQRAYCYDKTHDYPSAISDLTKFIQLANYEPQTIRNAYYNRGCFKSALNDNNGAIKDYQRAVEIDPSFSMGYNNIAWEKFLMNDFSEALVFANKAVELDNQNTAAIDTRSEIKFNLNDYNGCVTDADMALKMDPKLGNAYFLKGKVAYQLGKKEEACNFWSKAGEFGKSEAYENISKYCK